jgi:NitT/TauT family transport system substrate-binding protein
MHILQSRRVFLANASLAAAASVLGPRASLAEELPPPETTTVRVALWRGYACLTPQSISEALLRAEGFTDVRFVPPSETAGVVQGSIDFDLESAPWVLASLDAGVPVTVLAGVHPGCFELFAHAPVRTITDLRGKRVAIDYVGSGPHMYLTIMLAQVGLDPATDVQWVADPIEAHATAGKTSMQRFVDHDVDAFLAFAPEPQELRDRNIGKVILNTAQDQPWSHYFCCMSYGRSQFVRDYPIATKRFLRAILKGADMCAAQPELAARQLVDAGYSDHYEYALQTLIDLPYGRWREYDPADTLRFFALRLYEVGMIRSNPNTIIAEGTDWRFLNELKRELKA